MSHDCINKIISGSQLNVSFDKGPGQNECFEITNEELLNVEDPTIFWSYPTGTMMIRFIADPHSKTPFKLHLKETSEIYDDIKLYRRLDDKEEPIEKGATEVDVLIFESDSHNQCLIKVVGTHNLKYYGISIKFSIEKTQKLN